MLHNIVPAVSNGVSPHVDREVRHEVGHQFLAQCKFGRLIPAPSPNSSPDGMSDHSQSLTVEDVVRRDGRREHGIRICPSNDRLVDVQIHEETAPQLAKIPSTLQDGGIVR